MRKVRKTFEESVGCVLMFGVGEVVGGLGGRMIRMGTSAEWMQRKSNAMRKGRRLLGLRKKNSWDPYKV